MTFIERLQHVIDELDEGNVSAFSRSCGLSNSTIAGYLDGTSIPKIDKVARIAEVKGISLDWLIAGRGEMTSGSVSAEQLAAPDDRNTYEQMLDDADVFLRAGTDLPYDIAGLPTEAAKVWESLRLVAERSTDEGQRAHADLLLSLAFRDRAAEMRRAETEQRVFARLREAGTILREAADKLSWTPPVGVAEALKTLIFIYSMGHDDVIDALSMIKSDWDGRP